MLARIIRRIVPLTLAASVVATGAPLAPASEVKVDVSSSSVKLTSQGSSSVQSEVLSRSVVDDNGETRSTESVSTASSGFRAHVENPNEGQLFGFVWSGTPSARLEVRTEDAAGWSPWLPVESEDMPDPSREAVRPGIGPIWAGDGVQSIDVRVLEGSLEDFRLDSFHMNVSGGNGGIASAGGALNIPHIISRSEWGAQPWGSQNPGCGSGPSTAPLNTAVIHHTAHTNNYSPAQAFGMVRAIQSFEIGSRGFCDLSYNFIVDRYGQIFEGRSNSVFASVIGGHARGSNTGSVGIALLGQYQPGASPPAADVTAAEYSSLRDLLSWKLAWHGVDPLSSVSEVSDCSSADGYAGCRFPAGTPYTHPAIVGHRDVTHTACPGDFVMSLLNRLRTDVAARVAASGPYYPLDAKQWEPDPDGPAVVTMDAFGGLHPGGSARAVPSSTFWPGWGIARDAEGTPSGGYVLDGWGGLHQFGAAPPVRGGPYWAGWDIARGFAFGQSPTSGYVVSGWGSVHPFGGAPPAVGGPYWAGWDIARDIVTLPGGNGGYVLSGWGSIHPFGTAPPVTDGPYWPGWDIARAIVLNPGGPGGYVLDGWGGLHSFGGAPALSISHWTGTVDHRDVVLFRGGRGYVVDARGHLWPVGSAPHRSVWLTSNGYDAARSVIGAG
jgi:N-acetylmuramoyl-L-alanine amidase